MEEEAQTPIFVIEGNDVGVYRSRADAERDIEPNHVKEGIYEAFDARGRRLKLAAAGHRTVIDLPKPYEQDPDLLAAKLRYYLAYIKDPAGDDPTCDLRCLIHASLTYAYEPFSLRRVVKELIRNVGDVVKR